MRTKLLTLTCCFFASTAFAATSVGKFRVSVEKDPFGESDSYIALTVQGTGGFAVRCLSGQLSLAFMVRSKAEEGLDAEVKLKLDEGSVETFDGGVVGAGSALVGAVIQAGNKEFIGRMAKAKRLAMKYQINGVGATYSYDLDGIDRVVTGVQKACKIAP